MVPADPEGLELNRIKAREDPSSDETIGAEEDGLFPLSVSKQKLDARQYSQSFLGQTLGDYRILREIGHGSMGIVFEARHDQLDRVVALKVLPPSLSVTETVIKRFMREAQSVAKLDHENIVRIYTTGDQDGVYFYAMQFIEGSPIDVVLRERKLSCEESARIVAQAARALFFAHEHSIIHRDVKPANIILSYKDRPVLTDFGLARPEKAATLTASGALVGTPIYMSPEQVRGDRQGIDRRTDIYSLGITFYEMLTGATPFEAESTQEILNKIEHQDPRPVRKVLPSVPKALETICHKAIEKDVGQRYQTAIELALDLERFLCGEPIQARPTPVHTRLVKRMVRHRTIVSLAALLSIAVVLILLSTRKGREDQENARSAQYGQLLTKGQALLRDNQNAAALRQFDQAIYLQGDVAEAYVERGKAYRKMENYESAVQDFGHALELEPEGLHARFWRAESRLRYGSREEREAGMEDLEAVLSAGPAGTELLLEISRLCLEVAAQGGMGGVSRDNLLSYGQQYISRLLDLDPRNDDALVMQGLYLEEQGMLEEALSLYEKAKQINPNNAQAMTLFLTKRETRPPAETANPRTASVAEVAPWWTVLGAQGVGWATKQINVDEKMLSRAIDALSLWNRREAPRDQVPDEPLAVEDRLAEADNLWSEGQLALAAPIYEEVLARHPRLAEPNNRLAEYYLDGSRDLEQAQIHIGQALEIAPTNARSLLIALEVYNVAGEREKLEQVVRTIRQYYPFVDANAAYRKAVEALGGSPPR